MKKGIIGLCTLLCVAVNVSYADVFDAQSNNDNGKQQVTVNNPTETSVDNKTDFINRYSVSVQS